MALPLFVIDRIDRCGADRVKSNLRRASAPRRRMRMSVNRQLERRGRVNGVCDNNAQIQ